MQAGTASGGNGRGYLTVFNFGSWRSNYRLILALENWERLVGQVTHNVVW